LAPVGELGVIFVEWPANSPPRVRILTDEATRGGGAEGRS
jgi:hypothetical protein